MRLENERFFLAIGIETNKPFTEENILANLPQASGHPLGVWVKDVTGKIDIPIAAIYKSWMVNRYIVDTTEGPKRFRIENIKEMMDYICST